MLTYSWLISSFAPFILGKDRGILRGVIENGLYFICPFDVLGSKV